MRMVTIVLHVTQKHSSNTICVGMEWPISEVHRRVYWAFLGTAGVRHLLRIQCYNSLFWFHVKNGVYVEALEFWRSFFVV